MRRSVVVVGAGPRGVGVLERLAASAGEFGVGPGAELDVHLVDPYPPGAGRIWRHEQSSLLWMNSMAADVTMFTDDSVRCDGPIVPGPSLYEWAEQVREVLLGEPALTQVLGPVPHRRPGDDRSVAPDRVVGEHRDVGGHRVHR